jgi:hypothetical protein
MVRVTAGALGPLTQRVILPVFLTAGVDSMPRFWDLFVTSAWFAAGVNFVIVEWWIRRFAPTAVEAYYPLRSPRAASTLAAYAEPKRAN